MRTIPTERVTPWNVEYNNIKYEKIKKIILGSRRSSALKLQSNYNI